MVAAKSLLSSFAEKVSSLDKSVIKNVCEYALSRLLNRTVSFEEQVRYESLLDNTVKGLSSTNVKGQSTKLILGSKYKVLSVVRVYFCVYV